MRLSSGTRESVLHSSHETIVHPRPIRMIDIIHAAHHANTSKYIMVTTSASAVVSIMCVLIWFFRCFSCSTIEVVIVCGLLIYTSNNNWYMVMRLCDSISCLRHSELFVHLPYTQTSMSIQMKRECEVDDDQLVSKRTEVACLTPFPLRCVHSVFEIPYILDIMFAYESVQLYGSSDKEKLHLMENGMYTLGLLIELSEEREATPGVVCNHCVASVLTLQSVQLPEHVGGDVDVLRVLSIVSHYADDATFIAIMQTFVSREDSEVFQCSNTVIRRTVQLLRVVEWIPIKHAALPSLEKRAAACAGFGLRLAGKRKDKAVAFESRCVMQLLSSGNISLLELGRMKMRMAAQIRLRAIARRFVLSTSCALSMVWRKETIVDMLKSFGLYLGLNTTNSWDRFIRVDQESNLIYLECGTYSKKTFSSEADTLLLEYGYGLFLSHISCDQRDKCGRCDVSPCVHGDRACEIKRNCVMCSEECSAPVLHTKYAHVQHIRTHPYLKILF